MDDRLSHQQGRRPPGRRMAAHADGKDSLWTSPRDQPSGSAVAVASRRSTSCSAMTGSSFTKMPVGLTTL